MTEAKLFSNKQKSYFAILMFFVIPLAGMCTDIYLPSLPAMALHFSVVNTLAQTTVTSYVLAVGLCQMFIGPISDAFGRKRILISAFILQFLCVLGILFSSSIYEVIALRFVQGVGAASMTVPARAVLSDIFAGMELKKWFNYASICFALGPIIAPFIGGYLQHYFFWQANFLFILAYIIVALTLVSLTLPETIKQKYALSLPTLYKNYHRVLTCRVFVTAAIFAGMVWGVGAFFNVAGPFLIQKTLGFNAVTYGHMALLVGIAWFLGNMLNRFLFDYDKTKKTLIALWLSVVTVALGLVFALMGGLSLPLLIIPTFIILFLGGMLFPVYLGECVVIFPDIAASSGACLFTIIWLVVGVYMFIGSLLNLHSLQPIMIAYLVSVLLAFFVFYGLLKGSSLFNKKV